MVTTRDISNISSSNSTAPLETTTTATISVVVLLPTNIRAASRSSKATIPTTMEVVISSNNSNSSSNISTMTEITLSILKIPTIKEVATTRWMLARLTSTVVPPQISLSQGPGQVPWCLSKMVKSDFSLTSTNLPSVRNFPCSSMK
jgi:hypothetical protein